MRIWDAYRRRDIVEHNALLSDDYRAVYPDGSIHPKPTRHQFASEPMSSFKFSDFLAEPLGEDFALVSYIADVEGPGPGGRQVQARFVVGEVWAREAGEWKVRKYQPTVVKPASN
jgi:ketosteroid isomerase-like protein